MISNLINKIKRIKLRYNLLRKFGYTRRKCWYLILFPRNKLKRIADIQYNHMLGCYHLKIISSLKSDAFELAFILKELNLQFSSMETDIEFKKQYNKWKLYFDNRNEIFSGHKLENWR